jgi:quercetin dioxygenase-like cupin family protein
VRRTLSTLGAGIVVATLAIAQPGAACADDLTRTVLMKKDLEGSPNKEVTVFVAQYKPGARSGKHYHPGQEFIYVVSGHGRMEEVGKPPVDMTPGTALYFQSDPKNPAYAHEAIDLGGGEGMKLLVVLITEKGQPLAIPAK